MVSGVFDFLKAFEDKVGLQVFVEFLDVVSHMFLICGTQVVVGRRGEGGECSIKEAGEG